MKKNTHRIDAASLEKAHALFESGDIDRIEVGTVTGLVTPSPAKTQQIVEGLRRPGHEFSSIGL